MNRRTAMSLLAALPLAPRAAAGWPADDDWNKIPAAANALLFADVRKLYSSPIGQRMGWAKRFAESGHAGLTSLPPTITTATVAAQFDYTTMEPVWQLGLFKTDWLIPLGDIAKAEGSVISTVADRSAVLSPRDAYFTTVGNNHFAVYAPANRQSFSRWLRTVGGAGYTGGSAYIRQANQRGPDAQLIVVADIGDAVDPDSAKTFLGHMPTAKKNNLNPVSLSQLFSGLRGITLRVNAADALKARLTIDFSTSIGALGKYLGNLIDDILASAGANFDDMRDWKESFEDKSMILQGTLSPAGLHHLLMLFELPNSSAYDENRAGRPPAEKGTATATIRYFRSLSDILAELCNVKFKDNYERYAMWFERYAARIDQLPSYSVDPQLAQFGYTLAQQLRAMAGSFRGVPLKADQLAAGAYTYVSGASYGRRGRWGTIPSVDSNVPQVQSQIAKVVADDAQARTNLWHKIDDDMAKMKRGLSKKYNVVL